MSSDATEPQGGAERRRSRDISIQRERPPLEVPGYEPERYLGMGAYGEVWVALERNTGRRVAIKFYTHRGGLDWSLLSREVEKLAFLFADRYVVQLLGVGWNAEPPYYIMEYLEHGSLADRIRGGPLPVGEAVELFRHLAVGLVHAHGKGVLHCDLKPANVLLDQDGKPRLADFGQSRLANDQTPSLGTLFYMAPEQANLTAVPNARWDVYALGAVLFCMLTGKPPHWSEEIVAELEATDDLKKRLSIYRRTIRKTPLPQLHRQIPGVDRSLAEIIQRCLAPSPEQRYPNVQAVLEALHARDARRSRRPLMLLGAIGPILLLLVVTWFAWTGFGTAVGNANRFLTRRALQTNKFQAENLAKLAGYEIDRRLQRMSILANIRSLREAMAKATGPGSEMVPLLEKLSDPTLTDEELEPLRREFRKNNAQRAELQKLFSERVTRYALPDTCGYFLNDARGVQVAREPQASIIGRNYGWRSYFTGLMDDLSPLARPGPDGPHITEPYISAVYRSQATGKWVVAISAPIYDLSPEKKFLGTIAVMVEVGRFIRFSGENPAQFATLIDWRKGTNQGLVLQHPTLEKILEKDPKISDEELRKFKVKELRESTKDPGRLLDYRDPLLDPPDTHRKWLAHITPIPIDDKTPRPNNSMMVVVQEDYNQTIGQTLAQLKRRLISLGVLALAIIAIVMVGLWSLAIRMFRTETGETIESSPEGPSTESTSSEATSDTGSSESTKSARKKK